MGIVLGLSTVSSQAQTAEFYRINQYDDNSGNAYNIEFYSDSRCIFADGVNGIIVLDTTDPNDLSLVSNVTDEVVRDNQPIEWAIDMDINPRLNLMVVYTEIGNLYSYDITDLSSPHQSYSFSWFEGNDLGGMLKMPHMVDNTVYTYETPFYSDLGRVYGYDFTSSGTFSMSNYTISEGYQDVTGFSINDNTLYILTDTSLTAYSMGSGEPSLLGSYPDQGTFTIDYVGSLVVENGIAATIHNENGNFVSLIDVSSPTNMDLYSQVSVSAPIKRVVFDNNLMYILTASSLNVYDITDPTSAILDFTIESNLNFNDFSVRGDLIYIASSYGISIFSQTGTPYTDSNNSSVSTQSRVRPSKSSAPSLPLPLSFGSAVVSISLLVVVTYIGKEKRKYG